MDKKKEIKMPDTFIIIFFVVLFAALLTYVVPKGHFETEEITYTVDGKDKTRTVIKNGTFEYVTDDAGSPVKEGVKVFASDEDGGSGFLNYMFEGLVTGDKYGSAVGVVAFILVIGGAFGIVLSTGAIEGGIMRMIDKLNGKEVILLPVLFLLFSLGGAVFGMGEEAIPFVMIVVPMVIAMGYDAVVGIIITYVATQIGFATSWMNPFSVAVAQGISGIPVLSGANFRIAMWCIFNFIVIVYTMIYAKKIRKDPRRSVSYESDAYFREDFEKSKNTSMEFNLGHKLIILDLVLTMVWVVWGVTKKGYYIPEIATQFFTMGIVAGIIGIIFKLNNMSLNNMAVSFRNGAKDLLGPAMVVGMAQGIIFVLGGTDPTNGTVLNTILNTAASGISKLSPTISAWIMYVFQSVFNFFVVSGSGQASLTMPLMAPLADLAGVTRQVAVLAFQLGDGLTNLIVPTSGLLMAVLGAARLEWGKWAKFQIKMQALLFVVATVFVVAAVAMGFA
ncbi:MULTISPECIES: putative basic amino acid antiporter YfcC [Peptoniphilus]|uniref:putative basic amino acid antiporter YfcC n=1 Tax=Peptoniphilus TaxID=162289 RepID=UPI0001DA9D2C|nr:MULTISPECIES: putative basic amino acid antiporter YfcC [Peptoniphilus]EFI41306.1 C4-dicarboxylate anaerobic carrier [Peptoniphilus sp. oral taxon 386 str. F0131]